MEKKSDINIYNNTSIEQEKEDLSPEKELLYHYCFNINDLALSRLGIKEEHLKSIKDVLITSLAEQVAMELKDNWLIVHGKEKNVVIYEPNIINDEEKKKSIIKYYIEKEQVPEDTLYLGEQGLELYSRSVDKIEKHKATLEALTEHIEVLIDFLLEIENKPLNDGNKRDEQKIKISEYLETTKQQQRSLLKM